MNLESNYLGIKLKSPLMAGASPFADSLDQVKILEDSGASAIVLRSLFEEQILAEESAYDAHALSHQGTYAEASHGVLPTHGLDLPDFSMNLDRYLDQIRKIRNTVGLPVIGSLNGHTPGGWVHFASLMEQAGAHALELNFYDLPTDPNQTAKDLEESYLEILTALRKHIKIPIAVKLTPFFTSLPHFAQRLSYVGAQGVILFNRLYQPEIDIDELVTYSTLSLSTPEELALRLRWIGILHSNFKGSIALSGGVHSTEDIIKGIMAGADAVQMVSVLIKNGPKIIELFQQQLCEWLIKNEYESLSQLRGSMSLDRCPDPDAYNRTQYMKNLRGWSPSKSGKSIVY